MADIDSNLPVRDTADGTSGAAAPTIVQQVGGKDGSNNLQPLKIDAQGGAVVAGEGTAGTPTGGVVSIQGVASGTTVPVSGTVAATQSGTWTVQPGNTPNTTPWLTTDTADGPVTPGAVATRSGLIGGQYNSTLPTLTTTQQASVQFDSRGRLIVAPFSYNFFHPIFTTRVQTATNTNLSNSTTLVGTITASTAGSLLVVTATCSTGTLTITDSGAQVYSTALNTVSGSARNYMFYVANSAAGITTITITCTASTALNIIVSEYGTISTSSPLDKTASTAATGLTWTSGSTAATTQAAELLLGASMDASKNNVTFSPGTGWTSIASVQSGVGAGGGTAYQQERYVNAIGTYASTGSISASDLILAQIATFKLSGAPTNLTYVDSATTIKASSGTLSNVTINSLGAVGSTATFYDGSVTNANKIAVLSLSTSIGAINFNLTFATSLLMVVNSNSADFTVVYS